jgi:uncharacterized OB-fold protein
MRGDDSRSGLSDDEMREFPDGTVYTETVVHSPPEQFIADVPYQVAIIDVEGRGRVTVRITGKEPRDRAQIGDRVSFVERRGGVPYYSKASAPETHPTDS